MQTQDPFTPEVVAAVMRHMNVDHAADCLVICRGLGGQPAAVSALMSGMDADGIDFVAMVDGKQVKLHLPWSERIVDRSQIRGDVTRMCRQARATLGIEPVGGEA